MNEKCQQYLNEYSFIESLFCESNNEEGSIEHCNDLRNNDAESTKNKRANSERSKNTLYIIMPAYNEQDTIECVVRDWYRILNMVGFESKLIIADSGSEDKTHEILVDLKKEFPNLLILSDTIKYHGAKLIAMYKYAIEHKAEYIFQTDSDGQTNSGEFIEFWNNREKYDAIIGNRKVRGDGVLRKIIENIVCILLKIIFGVNVPDANAPFRLMNARLLAKYINRFNDDYNLPNIMLTAFFCYYNENIIFKEITFKPRQGGKNSLNLKRIIRIGINSVRDFIRFRRNL